MWSPLTYDVVPEQEEPFNIDVPEATKNVDLLVSVRLSSGKAQAARMLTPGPTISGSPKNPRSREAWAPGGGEEATVVPLKTVVAAGFDDCSMYLLSDGKSSDDATPFPKSPSPFQSPIPWSKPRKSCVQ